MQLQLVYCQSSDIWTCDPSHWNNNIFLKIHWVTTAHIQTEIQKLFLVLKQHQVTNKTDIEKSCPIKISSVGSLNIKLYIRDLQKGVHDP